MLVAGGTAGRRFELPKAWIMIHRGSDGFSGNVPDVEAAARKTLLLSNCCCEILARHAGQSFDRVRRDAERDYYLKAEEATAYRLVDGVLEERRGAVPEARA